MGVPRDPQPLAGHGLAGEFAAQVLQLHGQPRQPGQPVHQQAKRRASKVRKNSAPSHSSGVGPAAGLTVKNTGTLAITAANATGLAPPG